MRPVPNRRLEKLRRPDLEMRYAGATCEGTADGIFVMEPLRMIASSGDGWEHVSVSVADRCPTWDEMCLVKDLFWGSEECVMQLHPPRADYISCHPYTLHLWKPLEGTIPRPPNWMVGPKK